MVHAYVHLNSRVNFREKKTKKSGKKFSNESSCQYY